MSLRGAAGAVEMCALAKQSPFLIRDRRAVYFTRDGGTTPQTASAAGFESISVFDPRAQGQEIPGIARSAGKSDTPHFALLSKSVLIYTQLAISSSLHAPHGPALCLAIRLHVQWFVVKSCNLKNPCKITFDSCTMRPRQFQHVKEVMPTTHADQCGPPRIHSAKRESHGRLKSSSPHAIRRALSGDPGPDQH